ncbi:MAG: GGDEF domain-containing protein [Methyloligellaceae bacterium]
MSVQVNQTNRKNSEQLNPGPQTGPTVRRVRGDITPYNSIPKNELTPKVESAMSLLLQEVERLKNELSAANERVVLLENIAEEDPLIPILNRRGFERELERSIAYTGRYGIKTCVIYIDIDHFKSINDTHGHKAGDIALRHIASFLIENIRQSDIISRIGGDEFALILQHVGQNEAKTKAIQLENNIKDTPCCFEQLTIPMQISTGVSEIQKGDTIEEVMDRSDKEMYARRTKRRSSKATPSEKS